MNRQLLAALGAIGLAIATLQLPLRGWALAAWLLMCAIALLFWLAGIGSEADDPRPPTSRDHSPWRERLGDACVGIAGGAMAGLGWVGWSARDGGGLAGWLVVLLPVGLLFLTWLLAKLARRWLRGH